MSKRREHNTSRPLPSRNVADKILIVCEGKKTEKFYFESLIRYERLSSTQISIISGKHPAPTFVVNTAIEKMQKTDRPFSKVYCVIDRDEHGDFIDAQQLAKKNDIELIVSYPSFEYWYVCHFKFYRTYLTKSKDCEELLKKIWKDVFQQEYKKNLDDVYKQLEPQLETAIKNAQKALEQAQQEQEFNPSTQVHELVEYLRNIRQVK